MIHMNPLYIVAKEHLGDHLTLNPSVPAEVGCAEALSYLLKAAGYAIPSGGIQNVNGVISWLLANGFTEQDYPTVGGIITAHNADLSVTTYAHIGVVLKYGIGSNDSNTGLFMEKYTIDSWKEYFVTEGGSTARYFSC